MAKTYAKDDIRYWRQKVKKRGVGEGKTKFYYARIQHAGKQKWINLHSGNADTAASKARDIFLEVSEVGWDEYFARKDPKPEPCEGLTVGEYLREVEECSRLKKKTFNLYCRKFRTLVSSMEGYDLIPRHNEKLNDGTTASTKWKEKVDSVLLSKLTPVRVTKWMNAYIKDLDADPMAKNRAQHTVNSLIRNARSLFSKKLIKHLSHLSLPDPLPFEGVELFESGSMRYNSKMDPEQLLQNAKEELQKDQPEVFKAFVLCLLLGLRRSEADLLMWDSVDWKKKTIKVEANQYFVPKSTHSIGELALDDGLISVLQSWKEKARGPFVIESNVQPRMSQTYEHYRANKHFKALIKWLREKGVKERTPIHTLRKEFGRLITEKHGIYAASRLLRHGNIQITAAHYADDRRRLSTGLEVGL